MYIILDTAKTSQRSVQWLICKKFITVDYEYAIVTFICKNLDGFFYGLLMSINFLKATFECGNKILIDLIWVWESTNTHYLQS